MGARGRGWHLTPLLHRGPEEGETMARGPQQLSVSLMLQRNLQAELQVHERCYVFF